MVFQKRWLESRGLNHKQRVAWLVLAVSLLLTAIAWALTERYVNEAVTQRFDYQAKEIASSVAKRLKESQTVLRSTAGFISASEEVTREEWRRFVNVLRITDTNPGMQAVGYIPLVPKLELEAHVRAVRRTGLPDYRIWPPGERALYAPIAYMDPVTDINRAGYGFDAYSDPVRREIMEYARDVGEPAISPRVELALVSGIDRVGFIFYMPIYVNGAPIETISQRRAALRGYTLTAFRAEIFVKGIGLGDLDKLELEIFDGPVPSESGLIYDNHPGDTLAAKVPTVLSQLIEIPNRPRAWGLFVQAGPDFRTFSERYLPWLVAVGGVVIDILLFLTVWSQGRNRIELEELSETLRKDLVASEQVLGSAIDTMGEAFVIYDPDDKLIYCNERYRSVYALSAPVIQVGRSFEEIIRYGAERGQYPAAIGRIDDWVAERMERHRAADSELIQQLGDGRWIKIRERRTSSGHIVGIRMDLTEVYQAKEAAEAASRAKSRFLATVSHEIRTPMNGILGMAQILMDPEVMPDKRNEYVRTILRAGQALLTQVNDILDFSKMEAGKLHLSPVRFSAQTLVEETLKLFMANAVAKGIALEWQCKLPQDAAFVGDADRIRQMLSNLVGNAIKFTSRGEVRVCIEECEPSGEHAQLQFSVRDTGDGLSPEDQARLFQPFSQVDDSNARQHGGTGLGLSIVRQLSRLMGGDAGVESSLGQGSRFWFRIQVERSSEGNPAGGTESSAFASATPADSPRLNGRMLVAEDNATHRLVVVSALQKLGLSVHAVADGEQAVAAVSEGTAYDMIFLDLLMPVLDGLPALERIQAAYRSRGVPVPPVVAITAEAFEDDRERCLAAGMCDVITKPFNFDELTRVVRQYLPESTPAEAETLLPAIDHEAAKAEIRLLVELLTAHKFDAFASLSRLSSLLAGTPFAGELDKASALLKRMAFEQVLEIIKPLSASLEGEIRS